MISVFLLIGETEYNASEVIVKEEKSTKTLNKSDLILWQNKSSRKSFKFINLLPVKCFHLMTFCSTHYGKFVSYSSAIHERCLRLEVEILPCPVAKEPGRARFHLQRNFEVSIVSVFVLAITLCENPGMGVTVEFRDFHVFREYFALHD